MKDWDLAKDLTRRAVEQLRSAIYALNHSSDADRTSLPEMLEQLGVVHMPDELAVSVRVGGTPTELPGDAEHALLRIAGEALFNAAVHAHANRAVLRLTYRADSVLLSVSDDGDGDPARMRLILKLAATNDVDGRHRGSREHAGANTRVGWCARSTARADRWDSDSRATTTAV